MEKFRQEIEAAACIHNLEQREMNTCMLPGTHHLLHAYTAQDLLPREGCCLSWTVLSISVSVSKMILHRCTNKSASSRDPSWRASSHKILDCVKMTIKTVIRGLPKIPGRTQVVACRFSFYCTDKACPQATSTMSWQSSQVFSSSAGTLSSYIPYIHIAFISYSIYV